MVNHVPDVEVLTNRCIKGVTSLDVCTSEHYILDQHIKSTHRSSSVHIFISLSVLSVDSKGKLDG